MLGGPRGDRGAGPPEQVYPVAQVYAGNLLYPAEPAGEVLRRWRDWAPQTATELTSAATPVNFPPLPGVPEPLRARASY